MIDTRAPYGLDPDGQLRQVDEVPQGKQAGLRCPGCSAPLWAKKGQQVAHHLSHAPGHPACEGWWHATAKRLLHVRWAHSVATREPLQIQHPCNCQWRHHRYNLVDDQVAPIDTIALEGRIPGTALRPDVAGWRGTWPAVLIEVVDTHAPEQPVIDVGLPVFEIHRTADHEQQLHEFRNSIPLVAKKAHNVPCPVPPRVSATDFSNMPRADVQRTIQRTDADASVDYHGFEARAAAKRGH